MQRHKFFSAPPPADRLSGSPSLWPIWYSRRKISPRSADRYKHKLGWKEDREATRHTKIQLSSFSYTTECEIIAFRL